MHIAICIVGYRNPDDIRRCLAALEGCDHRTFEVVICENGGEAAYDELVASLPGRLGGGQPVRIMLAPGNLGFAGGVNACIAAAPKADAWWVLNPDTEPRPDALSHLVRRLAVGDCQAVGGVLHFPDGVVQLYGGLWRPALARAVSLGNGSLLGAAVDPPAIERTQNYLSGASCLVGAAFVERVGVMREDYFLYCEEVEWFLRGGRLGMRLGFAPEAVVLHHQGTSTGNAVAITERSPLSVYLNERNRLLLTRDCFPALMPVAALAALGLLCLRFGRRGAWRQLGHALRGWWAGLRNLRGAP